MDNFSAPIEINHTLICQVFWQLFYFFISILQLLVSGFQDKIHLQTCLEEGLRLADQNNLQTVSIPSVGTGGFGLSASDSAQVTFKALGSFSKNCKNVRHLRVVVFQAQMVPDFFASATAGGSPKYERTGKRLLL